MGDTEVFHNPIAPADHDDSFTEADSTPAQKLTNEDFRKLMMTPRVGAQTPASTSASVREVAKGGLFAKPKRPEVAATERKKKKSAWLAKQKAKLGQDGETPAAQYRDRAKERRTGEDTDEVIPSSTADYRSVAPSAQQTQMDAERRKQVIEESKYLGGDIEHTHLVKGLDYALLDKTRAKITTAENEDDQLDSVSQKMDKEMERDITQFKTILAKNVHKVLFDNHRPVRNELFAPGRMAYRIDLEDDFAEFEVPTTIIRSKAECPSSGSGAITTNEIIIQKLTQIISLLRVGRRQAKKDKKKPGGFEDAEESSGVHVKRNLSPSARVPIYDDEDLGRHRDRDKHRDSRKGRERESRDNRYSDRRGGGGGRDRYEAEKSQRSERERAREDTKSRGDKKRGNYFDSADPDLKKEDLWQSDNRNLGQVARQLKKVYEDEPGGVRQDKEKRRAERMKKKMEVSGYDECYPGFTESYDAMGDSDDEADFSKMDPGKKKGPMNRWDFDSSEDYANFMSSKEALPRAAFQYGVKMSDGRKTRRKEGPKDEKAELNRQWQKIQTMITKRKGPAGDGGAPEAKSARY